MRMSRREVLATALLAAAPVTAYAQAGYPSRPLKFIVPVPPGNMLDTMPRLIGEKLTAKWGQPAVVENKPGAASNIGAEAVFKADPDGYTLLVTPPGPLAISQHVYTKRGFDPAQFTPVSTLIRFPFFITAHPNFPASNLQDLIARAKANPDKVTFATPGVSSTPHLMMEMLSRAAGVRFVHVPFAGMAPALNALLGGHVDVMFDTPGNVLPQIQEKRIKALAVTGDKRFAALPNVSTLTEVYPGVVHEDWFAVVAPPKTPGDVANKLSQAIAESLKMPDVVKRLTDVHLTIVGSTPAETGALMKSEAEKFRKVVAEAGIKVE